FDVVFSAPTSTTLLSNLQSPTYGDPLTFTASVTAASPDLDTPSGTVQFIVDGADFGTPVALESGVATSASTTMLAAGAHTVSAIYSGDSEFENSTAAGLNLTVAKAPLTVTALNQTMNHGDAVPTLTWTITGFVNGDDSGVVQGAPDLSTSANSSSSAGRYAI